MYSPKVGTGTAMRSIRSVLMSTISSVAPLPMIRFSGFTCRTAARFFWLVKELLRWDTT